jgi:large subunit ribosomal protein L15
LIRRVPKFGFTPRSRTEYQVVNVNTLEKLAAEKKLSGVISPEALYNAGAISNKREPVKILGEGELKSKLEVTAHAFSKSAVTKIEAAGGKATVLS